MLVSSNILPLTIKKSKINTIYSKYPMECSPAGIYDYVNFPIRNYERMKTNTLLRGMLGYGEFLSCEVSLKRDDQNYIML